MTTKTIKTILFASLIVAMILPFSGMNFAQAQKADILDDKKYWLQLFKADALASDSTLTEQRYDELMVEYLKTRNADQIELDAQTEILSKIVLDAQARGENYLESEAFNKQLEIIRDLPIVKAAEYVNNLPEGIHFTEDGSIADNISTSEDSTKPVSSTAEQYGIHFVSSDYNPPITPLTFDQGVKLGHGAYVSYPQFNIGGVVINGLVWNTSSNADEGYRSQGAVSIYFGTFELVGEVCLNDDGTMTSVDFKQVDNANIVSSIQTVLFYDYDVEYHTFYWYNSLGSCYQNKDTVHNIAAGSTGTELTGLLDVDVS